MALRNDGSFEDWILPEGECCWIKCGKAVLWIKRWGTEIVIETYPPWDVGGLPIDQYVIKDSDLPEEPEPQLKLVDPCTMAKNQRELEMEREDEV